MAKKRHFDGSPLNILRMKAYEMAPKMIAAFALVLYENTNLSRDDIEDLCSKVAPLYERAEAEGWDIRKNCSELLDIDVFHDKERKNAKS